jgi:hypothetical protein
MVAAAVDEQVEMEVAGHRRYRGAAGVAIIGRNNALPVIAFLRRRLMKRSLSTQVPNLLRWRRQPRMAGGHSGGMSRRHALLHDARGRCGRHAATRWNCRPEISGERTSI